MQVVLHGGEAWEWAVWAKRYVVYVSAEISAFAVFPGHLAAPFSPLSPWC